jgi:hypothetical protein
MTLPSSASRRALIDRLHPGHGTFLGWREAATEPSRPLLVLGVALYAIGSQVSFPGPAIFTSAYPLSMRRLPTVLFKGLTRVNQAVVLDFASTWCR